jgi:hypothetical protein
LQQSRAIAVQLLVTSLPLLLLLPPLPPLQPPLLLLLLGEEVQLTRGVADDVASRPGGGGG